MLRHISFTLLFLIVGKSWSQNYHYTKQTGGNPRAANGVMLNNQDDGADDVNGGGWTLLMDREDSVWYSDAVSVPFSFQFNGNAVTALKAANSGYVTFTTSVTGKAIKTALNLPNAAIPDQTIAIMGMQGKGVNDKILTKVFGTAPNRQFWIKFNSMSSPMDTVDGESFNYWSVVLEETSNNIYVVGMYFGHPAGGYVSPVHSIGLQVNASTAMAVSGSPNIENAEKGKHFSDNFYYQFSPGTVGAYDLDLALANGNKHSVKTGNAVEVHYIVKNNGTQKVDSLLVSHQINNGVIFTKKHTGLSLAPAAETTLEDVLSPVFNAGAAGTLYDFRIWVSDPNAGVDFDNTNDTAVFTVVAGNGGTGKKRILLESATAAWCNTCPIVNRSLGDLLQKYGDTLILVQHHQLDEMQGNNDSLFSAYFSESPKVMLNRNNWAGGKAQPADSVAKRIELLKSASDVVPAEITLSAVEINENTGVVKYRVTANFSDYYFGDLRLGGMVLEDNVRGVGAGFNQSIKSAYTSDPNNWYYRFANPIVGYYHNQVAWSNNGGFYGSGPGVEKLYQPGDSLTAEFTYTFAEVLKKVDLVSSPYYPIGEIYSLGKPADIKVVGYLNSVEGEDQSILNSNVANVWNITAKTRSDAAASIKLFPIPTSGQLFVAAPSGSYNIEVFACNGSKIYDSKNVYCDAVMELHMAEIASNPGVYFLKLTNAVGAVSSHRVVLSN